MHLKNIIHQNSDEEAENCDMYIYIYIYIYKIAAKKKNQIFFFKKPTSDLLATRDLLATLTFSFFFFRSLLFYCSLDSQILPPVLFQVQIRDQHCHTTLFWVQNFKHVVWNLTHNSIIIHIYLLFYTKYLNIHNIYTENTGFIEYIQYTIITKMNTNEAPFDYNLTFIE